MRACIGCGRDPEGAGHALTQERCLELEMERARALLPTRAPAHPKATASLDPYSLDSIVEQAAQAQAALEASPHSCPSCGAKKLRAETPCGACAQEVERQRERARRARERLAAVQIPPYFRDVTFGAIEMGTWTVRDRMAVQASRNVDVHSFEHLTFSGNSGAGKTSLATAVLRKAHDAGRECLYVDAQELAHAHGEYGDEPSLVTRAIHRDVVLVDDLGQDPRVASDWVTHVLHTRHRSRRATIVTTGLTPEAIYAKYSAGMMRRVYIETVHIEVAGAKLVVPDGRQLRALQTKGG